MRDARRFSAREVSHGVQRHVLAQTTWSGSTVVRSAARFHWFCGPQLRGPPGGSGTKPDARRGQIGHPSGRRATACTASSAPAVDRDHEWVVTAAVMGSDAPVSVGRHQRSCATGLCALPVSGSLHPPNGPGRRGPRRARGGGARLRAGLATGRSGERRSTRARRFNDRRRTRSSSRRTRCTCTRS
jgi:hypothetical protein